MQTVNARPGNARTFLIHMFGRGLEDDLDGAKGRSLFVRLSGPGVPGKWTDAATSEHGDLLDLIRHRCGAPTLRAALTEARAFLALPASPGRSPSCLGSPPVAARRCRPR